MVSKSKKQIKPKLIKNKKTNKRYLVLGTKKYLINSTASDRYILKNMFDIIKQLINKKSRRRRRNNIKKESKHNPKEPTISGSSSSEKGGSFKLINEMQKQETKLIELQKKIDKHVKTIENTDKEIKDTQKMIDDGKSTNKDEKLLSKAINRANQEQEHNQKIRQEKDKLEIDIKQLSNIRDELANSNIIAEDKLNDMTNKIYNMQNQLNIMTDQLEKANKILIQKEQEIKEVNIAKEKEVEAIKITKEQEKLNEIEMIKTESAFDLIKKAISTKNIILIAKKFEDEISKEANQLDKNDKFLWINDNPGSKRYINYLINLINDDKLAKTYYGINQKIKNDMQNKEFIKEIINDEYIYIVDEPPLLDIKDLPSPILNEMKIDEPENKVIKKEPNKKKVTQESINKEMLQQSESLNKKETNAEKAKRIDNLMKNKMTDPETLTLLNSSLIDRFKSMQDNESDSENNKEEEWIEDTDIVGSGKAKIKGLWNYELEQLMKKYVKYGFVGVYPIDKIKKIPINSNNQTISFIMNTMPENIKQGHWVSVLLTKNTLEYFDPFGYPPSDIFITNIKSILNQWTNEPLQFKINRIKAQSVKTDTCGWHSIKFLIDRYHGKSFREISKYNKLIGVLKSEKQINQFKKKFSLPDFEYI